MTIHSSHSSDAHELLEAQLWDLRAQAEAKLRCLTRVQQLVSEHQRLAGAPDRSEKRAKIIDDLTDLLTLSGRLGNTAAEALDTAQQLP